MILQQEKESSITQTNNLLIELKRYQETIVPDLEQKNETMKIQLQNQGRNF